MMPPPHMMPGMPPPLGVMPPKGSCLACHPKGYRGVLILMALQWAVRHLDKLSWAVWGAAWSASFLKEGGESYGCNIYAL